MNTMQKTQSVKTDKEVEFVTFYVGNLLIGVDILHVEEINRQVKITPVPHAPEQVRGVINLRGEVVTVVDLRKVLGMQNTQIDEQSRTVVVNSGNEVIGLLVDSIADVVRFQADEIDPPPANVNGVDNRFFQGVHKLDHALLIVLNVEEAVAVNVVGSAVV